MINLENYEVWFLTGSQHLYGPETLKQVDEDSRQIAQGQRAFVQLAVAHAGERSLHPLLLRAAAARAVNGVAEQRVLQVVHVHADLVRAPGLQA